MQKCVDYRSSEREGQHFIIHIAADADHQGSHKVGRHIHYGRSLRYGDV